MAQINVRVDDSTKEKWEKAIEGDARYKSVQDLIRNATEDFIEENDLL